MNSKAIKLIKKDLLSKKAINKVFVSYFKTVDRGEVAIYHPLLSEIKRQYNRLTRKEKTIYLQKLKENGSK